MTKENNAVLKINDALKGSGERHKACSFPPWRGKVGVARMRGKSGFTLIELLVVILIIAILAAIALPQYQKAVWRSRNAGLKQMLKTVSQAEEIYYLSHGKYATNFSELDISLPLQTVETTPKTVYNSACGSWVPGTNSVLKGNNFVVIINSSKTGEVERPGSIALVARYFTGPYICNGFTMQPTTHVLSCREHTSYNPAGGFCQKLERGTLRTSDDWWRYYKLP